MILTIDHILDLIEELPINVAFNYVSGGDSKAKLLSIDRKNVKVDIVRINADGSEKNASMTTDILNTLANNIKENKPFKFDNVLNGSGNVRSTMEAIFAHTSEFYSCKIKHVKHLIWVPLIPHRIGEIVQYDSIKNKLSEIANEKKSKIIKRYRPYLTALRTKPFMLLAGISGTGKSRIVRKLAQATTTQKYNNDEDRWKDNRPENFELIQVKPNWHNSMDVVGFYSNISKKYEFTPFVEFIVKAWQHKDTPYFLCLDEMNLAPVEEYFAEFLSAIESRSTDENGEYITDPIIKPFKKFGKDVCEAMLKHLLGEAHHTESNPLAVQLSEKGLTLPPNLMVMGTVNMDETTFSFSRKVLDRAMSVEMNEVDYDKFLSGESELFPLLTDMNDLLVNRPQRAAEVTAEIESDKVIAYLKDVNTLMEGTPFKLGYRAANEAMLYVAACKKFAGNDYALAKALDEFTLMKILSRIEGDDSRLGIADDDPRIAALDIETSEQHTSLLTCLKAIIRKHIGASSETEKKIDQMCNTLEREHFVSYWA